MKRFKQNFTREKWFSRLFIFYDFFQQVNLTPVQPTEGCVCIAEFLTHPNVLEN